MSRERLAWMSAAVFAAAAAILWFSRSTAVPLPLPARLTFDAGVATWPAISSDGRLVVFASDRDGGTNLDLYIQRVGDTTATRLTQTPEDESQPDFSPDGGTIAYRSEKDGGGIWTIPVTGGEAKLLVPGGQNPRYSPDGKWIAFWMPGRNAFVIASSGGPTRRVGADLADGSFPVWSPDGQSLMMGHRGFVAPASGDARAHETDFHFQGDDLNWIPAGLVYSQRSGWTRNIYLRSFVAGARATGTPSPLTNGTEIVDHVRASIAGRIVFAGGTERFNFWRLPVDTDSARPTGGLSRITDGFQSVQFQKNPAPSHTSPNGRWTYSFSCRGGRCSIQASPVAPNGGAPVTVYDGDTPRLSVAAVNPQVQDLQVERDHIVLILAERTSSVWLMDLHEVSR